MQEKNQHSLQRKQRAGVRRKGVQQGVRGTMGHSYFRKNCIEVWRFTGSQTVGHD